MCELMAVVVLALVVCVTRAIIAEGWSPWKVYLRCPCGWGYIPATPNNTWRAKHDSDQWLCSDCGSPHRELRFWVGRYNKMSDKWQWLPEDKLPVELLPAKKQDERVLQEALKLLPELMEEEIQKRVAIELELERAMRQRTP